MIWIFTYPCHSSVPHNLRHMYRCIYFRNPDSGHVDTDYLCMLQLTKKFQINQAFLYIFCSKDWINTIVLMHFWWVVELLKKCFSVIQWAAYRFHQTITTYLFHSCLPWIPEDSYTGTPDWCLYTSHHYDRLFHCTLSLNVTTHCIYLNYQTVMILFYSYIQVTWTRSSFFPCLSAIDSMFK
jgi:hypothetical protein